MSSRKSEIRSPLNAPLRRRLAPLFGIVGLLGNAMPASALDAQKLEAQLKPELARLPKEAACALVVESLAGTRLFAENADVPLKPASVLKLFTTAAALLRLGESFEFRTEILLAGDDLVVIGGGDPALGDERVARRRGEKVEALFDQIAAELHRRNIKSINKIALDDGFFDAEFRHVDWPADQAAEWYQAPVGAINFNDNCVDAQARVKDGKIVLVLTPTLPAAFFKNELKVGQKSKAAAVRAPDSDLIRYTGVINKNTTFGAVAVREPTLFFGHALKSALSARGFAADSEIVRRKTTADVRRSATPLVVHKTPMRDVLWRCNTFSQNLFAECLIKLIGAVGPDGKPTGHTGSWERGGYVVRKTLADAGVSMDSAVIRDGSGLSHDNRVTAAQVTHVLRVMARHSTGKLFRESLAEPTEDGTLDRGYDAPSLKGRIDAKTGTIKGVKALAGYLRRADGEEVVFALLVNGEAPANFRQKVARILSEAP